MRITGTNEIYIRAFELSDATEFVAACFESIDSVGEWMPWCHADYSVSEAEAWISLCATAIESRNSYDLGIFRQCDSKLIGSIAINQLDKRNRIGNIGYWVRKSMQCKGYAVQAVDLIKNYGFQTLGLVRLEIKIVTENIASIRVAERAGAEFECIAKNRLMHNGIAKSAAVYSFTSS